MLFYPNLLQLQFITQNKLFSIYYLACIQNKLKIKYSKHYNNIFSLPDKIHTNNLKNTTKQKKNCQQIRIPGYNHAFFLTPKSTFYIIFNIVCYDFRVQLK